MPVRPNFNPDYLYFVTTTAEKHVYIFKRESIIRIILDSLHFLRTSKRMELFAFVIMPNHIHLIWELLALNGKEMPHASFNKHTAHKITNDLKINHPAVLPFFEVDDKDRSYRI